ncbi:MAG: tryptophan 2,3-dioxygenase family protein [Pseudomonadota bacterium]|nr:tryptophan 2,3-dioxygenase family protein [Pseudomonadota bacterium]
MSNFQRESAPSGISRNPMTYVDYLRLDQILGAQQPLSDPPYHDEMLFIVQHQVTELWMKLILHELKATLRHIRSDRLDPCLKALARVRGIQRLLFDQWGVLETLTPSEYATFRHVLGQASGLQSFQYRAIEFILGNKYRAMLDLFEPDSAAYSELENLLERPGLYDEFLSHLHRAGFPVPPDCLERDWSQPYRRHPELVSTYKRIYENPHRYWRQYALCERLVDLEEHFQLWRFRHVKTVERIIGYKPGTGGTSGVSYLQKTLEQRFFPELLDVRTQIDA